jgi:hypothetical protein
VENPAMAASGGAGIQAAQFVVERGAQAGHHPIPAIWHPGGDRSLGHRGSRVGAVYGWRVAGGCTVPSKY